MISKKVKCVTYYDPKNPQTNKNTKKWLYGLNQKSNKNLKRDNYRVLEQCCNERTKVQCYNKEKK